MDRLLRMYRTTTTAEPVVSLVLANLIPLVGVLFWGWDLWTILALYWAENGIIGLINVVKIMTAEGTVGLPGAAGLSAGGGLRTGPGAGGVPGAGPPAAGAGLPGGAGQPAIGASAAVKPLLGCGRPAMAGFFLVHYGMFWVGHGVFVLYALPAFGGAGLPFDGVAANLDQVRYGAIGLAISHGVSFWFNYIGRREYRLASPARLMGAPYARVVVLHVTIIVGAFVSMILGTPIGALVVLVLLKTGLDLSLHRREHEGLARAGSVTPSGSAPPPGSATPSGS